MNLYSESSIGFLLRPVQHYFIAILTILPLFMHTVYAAETVEFEPLSEVDLKSLEKHLTDIKALAPQLRTELRGMHMTANFDVREIHNIERSIGKAQIDIERMITMYTRSRINKVRAHFIADDLRRKANSLDQGLSYITMQIEKKHAISIKDENQRQQLNERENQLLSLLEDYRQLVKQSLQIISGEIR